MISRRKGLQLPEGPRWVSSQCQEFCGRQPFIKNKLIRHARVQKELILWFFLFLMHGGLGLIVV